MTPVGQLLPFPSGLLSDPDLFLELSRNWAALLPKVSLACYTALSVPARAGPFVDDWFCRFRSLSPVKVTNSYPLHSAVHKPSDGVAAVMIVTHRARLFRGRPKLPVINLLRTRRASSRRPQAVQTCQSSIVTGAKTACPVFCSSRKLHA